MGQISKQNDKKIINMKSNITDQFKTQGTRWGDELIEYYGYNIWNKDEDTIRIGFHLTKK